MKILDLYFLSSNGCDENVIIAGKARRNVILDNAPAFVGQKGENSQWSKSNFQFCTSKDFQVAAGRGWSTNKRILGHPIHPYLQYGNTQSIPIHPYLQYGNRLGSGFLDAFWQAAIVFNISSIGNSVLI